MKKLKKKLKETYEIEDEKHDWKEYEKDVVNFVSEFFFTNVSSFDLFLGQFFGETFSLQTTFLLFPQKPKLDRKNVRKTSIKLKQ